MLPSRRSWNLSHQRGHKWLWWTGKKPLIYAYSDLILSCSKMGNKTCNLFRNIVAKRVAMFTLYLPRPNLSFSKSSCGRLPEYWLITQDSRHIRGSCFTCCKTSLPWVGKTTFYFLQQFFATCDNLICCKTGWNVCGKTRNIFFHLVLR